MKKNCVIFGAGTYGEVYSLYLSSIYNVIGFIDDAIRLKDTLINNIPVLGGKDYLFANIPLDTNVFIPIGNNKVRVDLLKEVSEKGYPTPSFIHPQTIIDSSVLVGKAVYILPSTSIMPLTEIGNYVMISMGVNIAHHNIIGEGCFFSQGSNIGASIKINRLAYCGIASTIMTGVKFIGENSLIGAGAVIIKDVPDYAVVVGNPGKIIKYNS